MVLQAYEEEALFSMYDKRIIGEAGYTSIQAIASRIGWPEIANRYGVKKGFKRVIRHLASKGLVNLHGKGGNVASLSKLGVDYVIGKLKMGL